MIKIGITLLWVTAIAIGVRECMRPLQYADAGLTDPKAETLYLTAGECLVFPPRSVEPCSRYRASRTDSEVNRPLRFR